MRMDPLDPLDAQQIVAAYAHVVERDVREDRHPARIDSLPFAKPVIKAAIRTSARHLLESGQLTDDLCTYLETAYTLLAEYLDSELVELMSDYRSSAERLVIDRTTVDERTQTPAWRTLAETSALAGEVARTVTADAEALRSEFRNMLASV
jgi:hypothetical protein